MLESRSVFYFARYWFLLIREIPLRYRGLTRSDFTTIRLCREASRWKMTLCPPFISVDGFDTNCCEIGLS
ncbi:hypothetical protein KSP40_PGU022088 [Platanthera guangdongensis]|uniref:Uncharacterized protein n=1 Tax=Platanthera guangdongensis TaxID=2320717 RepID=A0ABR2M1M9_9ASPA